MAKAHFILVLALASFRLFAQPALPTTNRTFAPIANPYSGSWIYYTTDSVSGLGYLNGASIPYVTTVSNGVVTYVNMATNGFVTMAVTNGLATTNYVLALGLNETNFTLVTSNSLSVTFSNQLTAKSGTNINYSQITNPPVIPSTNGFVTAAVTNGLATTNFVLSQGYVTAAITNGLATTNYVKTATNGFVSATITNGLATTNFVLGQNFVTSVVTNGLATTNYVLAMGLNETNFTLAASNSLSVTFSNQLAGKSGTNINYSQITNAPVIPSTNGFVIAAVTNGLATTNYVLALGLNETNFTVAASNSLSVTFSNQLAGKSGTNINYSQITNAPVIPSTNGFVTAAVTNGLATTNFVLGQSFVTATVTNGLATTNYVLALGLNETNFTVATSNSLSVTFSNQLTGKAGTNINYSQITNAPVIPSTNGFVTAAVTNGLATTNFVLSQNYVSGSYSNKLVPTTFTIGASPAKLTNTFGKSVEVFLWGGVLQSVSLNGGSLMTNVSTIGLQTNEYITVIYTGTIQAQWHPFP